MNPSRLVLFPLAVLAACGGNDGSTTADQSSDAVLRTADGKIRIVHQADLRWKGDLAQNEMESVLERMPDIDIVYAHNDPMARGAAQACRQKGRTAIRIVGVDGLPDEGQKYVADGLLDATFAYPTCGREAIDLALLACSGVEVAPKRFKLGSRMYTKATVASGGSPIRSPDEVVLAQLQQRHADVLTTEPTIDIVFRVGMAQCTDDEPWRVQMGKDLRAAADRYPQIEFTYRAADDDTEKQRGIVRDYIAQNFNAILISPKESLALAGVAREAMDAGIHVIVIDRELGGDDGDFTCFVGGDNVRIGAAAATHVASLLGNDGGTIVELEGLMTSSPAQERHDGFVQELGLEKPR
ncbi:MAG: substrate-binding domain-containing protein [Planctomycetes bacterium]|nr:substrate-binding domain-containing protein [Planctomycetota bacterium]